MPACPAFGPAMRGWWVLMLGVVATAGGAACGSSVRAPTGAAPTAAPIASEAAPAAAPIASEAPTAVASEKPEEARATATPATYSLELLDRAPKGVEVATEPPDCTWVDESGPPRSQTVEVDGHSIRFTWHDQAILVATEGKEKLWEADHGHAGPIDATFCARSGWHAFLAGEHRGGFHAFDVRTGKKLARADAFVLAPNDRFAIILPPLSWGMSCFEASRAFRIPLSEAAKPYSLDTPPRPWRSLCDTDEAERDRTPRFTPRAAVSPGSDFYAVVEEREIVLLRTEDDLRVATVRRPALTSAAYAESFAFSSDGRYLVLRSSDDVDVTEWYAISVSR